MNIIPKTWIDAMTDVVIAGALLVALGHPLAANIVWTISNPYLTWYNHKIGQPEQAKLFFVLTIVGLFGIYNLMSW